MIVIKRNMQIGTYYKIVWRQNGEYSKEVVAKLLSIDNSQDPLFGIFSFEEIGSFYAMDFTALGVS